MLIFERSASGRNATAQAPLVKAEVTSIPAELMRKNKAGLPEVSELQVVRHYTNLSRKNFSIDT
jgi:glycine cleavage system P protein (glycine dehydrogenase) subunit 2